MMKLHLDTLYPLFCDAETTVWRGAELLSTPDDSIQESSLVKDTVGSQILRHGKAVRNIHGYFMNFEQRRCCINLVAGKTTLTNVRIIPVAREDCDEGCVESRSNSPCNVGKNSLSHQDFHLYCEAILCAQFPILGAPSPPQEHTPSVSPDELATPPIPLQTKDAYGSNLHIGGALNNMEFLTSLVKEEQVVELVRNVFGISHERAAQYDNIIFSLFGRQKPAKILAEELVRQLSLLENNNVPFYQSDQFLSRKRYVEWQKLERQRIMEMITKFWQGPLPSLSSHTGPNLPNNKGHRHYVRLMVKLIRYTRKLFPPSELFPTFLTSDAQRLLKEFGLRYGIGEQYRKLVYLEYVATHFLQEVWYVHHANAALCEILRTLPASPNRMTMVMEERRILEKCCECFLLECENSLRKVRHIFPGFSPHVSIGLLMELLRNTLKISSFLSGEPHLPINVLLQSWLENGFSTEYEQHKLMECYDLDLDPTRSLLSPRLLYRIIIKIRDSVRSYRNEYESIFKSYLEIHKMAALCFYKRLMSDVKVMCEDAQVSHDENELSLQMVSFAYRLSQLDRDWYQYIPKHEQTWRKSYLPEVLHWVNVVQKHSISLILQSVASDKFSSLEIEEREILPGMTPFCPKYPKSLSPSQLSAFSDTFHLVSQDSCVSTPTTRKSRANLFTQAFSNEALQRGEQGKRRTLNSVSSEKTSRETQRIKTRATLSVPDVRLRRKSPLTLQNDVLGADLGGARRRSSLSIVRETVREQASSLSKSMSSPEIHALMQRNTDMKKIKDESLMRSADDMSCGDSRSCPNDPGFGRFNSLQIVNNSDNSEMLVGDLTGRKWVTDQENTRDKWAVGRDNTRDKSQDTLDRQQECDDLQSAREEHNIRRVTPLLNLHRQTSYEDRHGSDRQKGQANYKDRQNVQREAANKESVIRYDEPFVDQPETQYQTKEPRQYPTTEKEKPVRSPKSVTPNVIISQSFGPVRNRLTSVIAGHGVFSESSLSDIPKLSRQSSNLSDIFKEVRAKACMSGWSSPDVRFGLPLTSSPFSVDTEATSFEVISGNVIASSSVVDLLCLLNRTLNFVKTFSELVYPLNFAENAQRIDAGTELRDLREEVVLGRKLLLDKLRRLVFVCTSVFSQNMLAMDMCSLTEEVGRELAGHKLLEDLRTGHECGHIWGCRHSANGHMTPHETEACFNYKNTKPKYLASKYEPIDSQMCLRINNLCEVSDLLDHHETQIDEALLVDKLKKELQDLFPNGAETTAEGSDAKETSREDEEGGTDSQNFIKRSKMVLQATRNALLHILTYRINLFVKDALAVLLSLQLPLVSIEGRLAPLSEFFHRHFDVLNRWLLHEAYLLAVQQLWELTVEDFSEEEKKLLDMKEYAPHYAKLLLQAIAHLIKVFSALDSKLDFSLMSSSASKVTFQLEVHTLSTNKLCSLARAFRNLESRQFQESLVTSDVFVPIQELLKQLHWCLHADRKSFTGQELLNWLLTHPRFFSMSVVSACSDLDVFGSVTPLTDHSDRDNLQPGDQELKRRAVAFIQHLIDSNVICPLMEEKRERRSPQFHNNSFNSATMTTKDGSKMHPYPNVVECISVGSSNLSGVLGVQSIVSGRGYDTDEESYEEEVSSKSEKRKTSDVSGNAKNRSNSQMLDKSTMEPIAEGLEAAKSEKSNRKSSLKSNLESNLKSNLQSNLPDSLSAPDLYRNYDGCGKNRSADDVAAEKGVRKVSGPFPGDSCGPGPLSDPCGPGPLSNSTGNDQKLKNDETLATADLTADSEQSRLPLRRQTFSETTSNSSAFIFQNTRSHYYYIHSLAAVLEDCPPADTTQEFCLDLYLENDVNFEFVMKILQARKKFDNEAKKFLKNMQKS